MDLEHISWLPGSYRLGTVVRPVEGADILVGELIQVCRGRNVSHAAADYSTLLAELRKTYRAVDQGADIVWVDTETGRKLVVEAKHYHDQGTRGRGSAGRPAEAHTYVPMDWPADTHSQVGVLEKGDPGRFDLFGVVPASSRGKSGTFWAMEWLRQQVGRVWGRRRVDPAEALEVLRRLIRVVGRAKRELGRLLDQLSYRPFLTKMIAVRLMHMHRGDDDPDSLLCLRQDPWTAGRPAAV